jgi:hypothetical protein
MHDCNRTDLMCEDDNGERGNRVFLLFHIGAPELGALVQLVARPGRKKKGCAPNTLPLISHKGGPHTIHTHTHPPKPAAAPHSTIQRL